MGLYQVAFCPINYQLCTVPTAILQSLPATDATETVLAHTQNCVTNTHTHTHTHTHTQEF
jgi:hypothetical protein